MRFTLIALATAALATSAFAAAPAGSSLTLADASRAPSGNTIIDGANWRCEGAECTATGGSNQPAARACRRVVQRLGQVTAFTYRGTPLSAEQLATCNA
jgi:hypothetical protein